MREVVVVVVDSVAGFLATLLFKYERNHYV